jgi:hypothetical protein
MLTQKQRQSTSGKADFAKQGVGSSGGCRQQRAALGSQQKRPQENILRSSAYF